MYLDCDVLMCNYFDLNIMSKLYNPEKLNVYGNCNDNKDEASCTNEEKTHGVCSWYNVEFTQTDGSKITGACLPVNLDY